ncbi:MAG: urea ABC transporter permease subunit UrtB [Methylococcales symbiont of Hymedesmia sp. n. MRB-2018]|nr:MAG: urea ABC transporter permease subunit UrtB [Methylococcales symbiont of Hymedesmia sp. n. MRB-2018]
MCPVRMVLWVLIFGFIKPAYSQLDEIDFIAPVVGQQEIEKPTYSETILNLKIRSLSKKGQAIERLVTFQNPQTINILQALADGYLFESREYGSIVIASSKENQYAIVLAEDNSQLGLVERSAIKKIKINNSIRSKIRRLIAKLHLNSVDPNLRLLAVKTLSKAINQDSLNILKILAETERDESVLDTLQLVIALDKLKSTDRLIRLEGIETLKEKTSLEAVNRLQAIIEQNSNGQFLEADTEVRKQAKSALVKIEARLQVYQAAETVFFGFSLGAVLVLAAIGLAITFGVMGVINMAHGEMMMLGAYTTYVVQQIMPHHIGLSIILAIPAAFMVSGLIGIVIERGIIRHLYGRPLETLLATFGVSLVLQQTVRSVFSPLNRSVITPEWMSGSWQINDFLSLTWNRLYILVFCLLVFAFLLQILKRTRLGLEVRAVSQNRNMAKAMGIPTGRVDAMTFGLGSGIAGVAGVALSQITNVGPNLGQAYIVDCFMVVVFGGVGNLWGTLIAGFVLGIANKVLEPFAGAVLAKILVLIFIILFIQKRPRGLFLQKGRGVES